MRGLTCVFLLLTACGTEQKSPDWAYNVTVTNEIEQCNAFDNVISSEYGTVGKEQFCSCIDEDGSNCYDDISPSTETFSYEFYWGGKDGAEEANSVAIEIDGQPFASGSVIGCNLEYESPTWLATTPDGEVQWSVTSYFVTVDSGGTCPIVSQHNLVGIEEYTVVESDNVQYPVGRTVRKVISGYTKAVGGE